MKRPRSDFSNDKDNKKKKFDHSQRQQCKVPNNEKTHVVNKTTPTSGFDPLFAGIAKKVLGNNASSLLSKEASPQTKKSATVTVKKENSKSSTPAKHHTSKEVQSDLPKQATKPTNRDSSSDSSSGVESLSSIDKHITPKVTIKKAVASTKQLSRVRKESSSSDTSSSSDDEPTSFVINPIVTKAVQKPSLNLSQQKKAKLEARSLESSSESSSSSESEPPAPIKTVPATGTKFAKNQPKLGRASSETSDSSSSSDSEPLLPTPKASSKTVARKPVKTKAPKKAASLESSSESSSSSESDQPASRKATPTTEKKFSGNQPKLGRTCSETSDSSSSSDSEPRLSTPKPLFEKIIRPSETKGSPSLKIPALKEVPKKAAPLESSSESSSSSESDAPTSRIAIPATGKKFPDNQPKLGRTSSETSDSSSSSDSDHLLLTPKTLSEKNSPPPGKTKGSASSSLKPPAPKTVLKNFVNSETSESSSSSDSESPLPTPKILSKMPARQPDKVKDGALPSPKLPTPKAVAPNQTLQTIPKKQLKSKAMISHESSSDSSDSSSDSEPRSFVPVNQKAKLKKTFEKPKEPAKSEPVMTDDSSSETSSSSDSDAPTRKRGVISKKLASETSSSESSSSSGKSMEKTASKGAAKQANRAVVTIRDDSSSDSSSMSVSEKASVNPKADKVVLKKADREKCGDSNGKIVRGALDSSISRPKLRVKNHSTSGLKLLGGAEFRKQPPLCVRKMNIIEMELSFYDLKGKPVNIKKACFVGYIQNDDEPDQGMKNGIHYKIEASFSDGDSHLQDIYLSVVDGRDNELICYEGKDIAECFQRVLLTHETTCARCRANESCGTRAKTPSNPVIIDGRVLKFYIKCNTTCAVRKGGRIGKNNNRTFKFIFSSSPHLTEDSILASSTLVNVHHNTKMKQMLNEGFNPLSREWGEPLPIHNI